MREKPVHFEITDCAQGTTLGLSLLPNCPRLSHISLRGLLPRRLLADSAEFDGFVDTVGVMPMLEVLAIIERRSTGPDR
jgi:hypothetical protein